MMSDRGGRAAPSERARSLRLAMWAMAGLSLLLLAIAFAGARGWLPARAGLAALWLSGASFVLVLWLGLRARTQAIADRERESGQAMIVVLAAQLARQDEVTLQRIAGQGGPAAEAARLILSGRRRLKEAGEHATAT